MAHDRGPGIPSQTAPFRYEKATLWMGLRTRLVLVMGPQGLADLAKRLRALHLALSLPIERESLAAHTTTNIRSIACGFAKNLHHRPLF